MADLSLVNLSLAPRSARPSAVREVNTRVTSHARPIARNGASISSARFSATVTTAATASRMAMDHTGGAGISGTAKWMIGATNAITM